MSNEYVWFSQRRFGNSSMNPNKEDRNRPIQSCFSAFYPYLKAPIFLRDVTNGRENIPLSQIDICLQRWFPLAVVILLLACSKRWWFRCLIDLHTRYSFFFSIWSCRSTLLTETDYLPLPKWWASTKDRWQQQRPRRISKAQLEDRPEVPINPMNNQSQRRRWVSSLWITKSKTECLPTLFSFRWLFLCFPRHEDLKQMLDSNKDNLKLDAMRRIIGVRDVWSIDRCLRIQFCLDDCQRKRCCRSFSSRCEKCRVEKYGSEEASLCLSDALCRRTTGSCSTLHRYVPTRTESTAINQSSCCFASISIFQDPNQLIRASALRVLSSIRVPTIVSIMMLAIREAVNDMSAYVRKTAANAIAKLYAYVFVTFIFLSSASRLI